MTDFVVRNRFVLVKPISENRQMGNGLRIKEDTRSRKSIVQGEIVKSDKSLNLPQNVICVYPLYAADTYMDGEQEYHILRMEDIMMTER